MRVLLVLVIASVPLAAADDARLVLDLKAQTEFDRVDLAGAARLEDAGQCVQSQAAALAVAPPADTALLHYRKGYCLLAGAATTHRAAEYSAAADELQKAIEAWPARAAIARLEAGPDAAGLERARAELAPAVNAPVCASDVMPAPFCQQVVAKGRQWLGWMALQRGDLPEAARDFTATSDAWADWVDGRQEFAARHYQAASARYDAAVVIWESERRQSPPNLLGSFGPRPDWGHTLTDLGGAQLLAGDLHRAIATLDRAAHEDPSLARPLYLRAVAKEAAGDEAGALADYGLAGRTAFAAAQDLASGEAHLYRGILLYRRKDYARAEEEFASALNFAIPPALRPDAEAWRHLAAVAGGSCQASRGYLEHSLESVSPFFPKAEARSMAASCTARNTAAAGGPRAN